MSAGKTPAEEHEDHLVPEDVHLEKSRSSCSSLSASVSCASASSSAAEQPRKRKGTANNHDTLELDTDDQDKSEGDELHGKMKCFRKPHSQIEKRRRDKMNNLIEELSAMIPTCNPMSRKLDKLTVLRMAVQHLKSLKGSMSSFSDITYKPSFLPDDELKHLVLRAADGFLFVVGCDGGKILFVSESVSKILNYCRAELMGRSLFDFVHHKDMCKVKEQLSACEPHQRETLIDAKTGVQVQTELPLGSARLCSGARRSFFCRMKYNRMTVKTEEKPLQPGASKKKESQRYCTVHCTGYMRSWPSTHADGECEGDVAKDASHFSCLVAVGRVHPHANTQNCMELKVKPTEFITRCAVDGKFTFVDQRATTVLGYLPQEMLGTSCYEYFHQDDLTHLADRHRKVLRSKEKIQTNCYKFKTKHGSFITLQSRWFSFINPWTKEVEYIVSTNTVIAAQSLTAEKLEPLQSPKHVEDDDKKALPIIPGVSTSSGSLIYAGSIGTQIANELLDFNRMNSSPSSASTSPFGALAERQSSVSRSHVPNGELSDPECPSRSTTESKMHGETLASSESLAGETPAPLDLEGLGNLSNDEAAMAVIMSLLETDAHLGDGVDLDEMHWSL